MGLDMFLYSGKIDEGVSVRDILDEKMSKVSDEGFLNYFNEMVAEEDTLISDLEEVAYWRKANAIHQFFASNTPGGIDDCEPYYVPKGSLDHLKDLVSEVLKDHSKADELLPSVSGFFFGSTEYDDYYFFYLKETLEKLNEIDKYHEDDMIYFYIPSW